MSKFFIIILLLIIVQNIQSQEKYHKYHNSRYGFSVLIPNSLRNVEHSVNGDGCRFWDPVTEFTVEVAGGRVYKENLEDIVQLREIYEKELREHEYITYSLLKDSYFAISGYDGNKIFYNKTFFDGEQVQTLIITYHNSDQNDYDEIVTKVSKSFIKGEGDY